MAEPVDVPADVHLPPYWRERLLGLLLAPLTTGNLELLDAQARAEGGSARWNPINTTFVQEPCTDYNSAGVKNYDTPVAGIAATARTLILEPYRHLWRDLQYGRLTAVQLVERNRAAFDTWGTGADNILRLLT
jgi:hypothetical protein